MDGLHISIADPRTAATVQQHFDWLDKVWPTFQCERGGIAYDRPPSSPPSSSADDHGEDANG